MAKLQHDSDRKKSILFQTNHSDITTDFFSTHSIVYI